MEPLQGRTLEQFIERHRAADSYLPEDEIWRMFAQIASAVQHMHARRICHRDIKPSNLVFENSTPAASLKLCDMGLAAYCGPDLLHTTAGTPRYMAPEVFSYGPYGFGCDVWSLGCVLLELAALEPAFDCPSMRNLRCMVTNGTPTARLPEQYSLEMRKTIDLMLQPDPSMRISMEQVLQLPHLAALVEPTDGKAADEEHEAASERLARALELIETARAQPEQASGCQAESLLAALLPAARYRRTSARYSKEVTSRATHHLRVALSSSFYAPTTPTRGAAADDKAALRHYSPSPGSSPCKQATVAGGGPRMVVHLNATAAGTAAACPAPAAIPAAAASPAGTASLPGAVCPLHPKYRHLWEAEQARRASLAPGTPISAPDTPAAAEAANRGTNGATSCTRTAQRRPARSRSSVLRTVERVRAAVRAGLQEQEDAEIRLLLAKVGRLVAARNASPAPSPRLKAAWPAQLDPERNYFNNFNGDAGSTHQDAKEAQHSHLKAPLAPASAKPADSGRLSDSSAPPTMPEPAACPAKHAFPAAAAEAAVSTTSEAGEGKGTAPPQTKVKKVWRLLDLISPRRATQNK